MSTIVNIFLLKSNIDNALTDVRNGALNEISIKDLLADAINHDY